MMASGIFRRAWDRYSLVPKMILITAAVGAAIFFAFDALQARRQARLFEESLSERLRESAREDRSRFDRAVEAYHHAVTLAAATKDFQSYLAERLRDGRGNGVIDHRELPSWLPSAAVLRHFATIQYALLLDRGGRVREVYRGPPEAIPAFLLDLPALLLSRSHEQSYTTMIEGKPFVLAAASATDAGGLVLGILVLVSEIDEDFLAKAQGREAQESVLVLIEEGGRILRSSREGLLPVGAALDSLKDRYLIAGESHIDRGGSDLRVRVASLQERSVFDTVKASLALAERLERLFLTLLLVAALAVVVSWITIRLRLLTDKIRDLSQERLGIVLRTPQTGDQLHILDQQFVNLTEEVLLTRDLAERRKVEEAVRISEKKYRTLHQSLMDGYVYVNMRGEIIDYNESYRAMLGYEPEELFRLSYQQLTPERWHAVEQRLVESQVLPRGYSEVYEKEYRRKDGGVFPVELRTFLIRDDAGAPSGMWAIVRDITERKRTEMLLVESEEKFRAVFNSATDGILIADTQSQRFVLVNATIANMLGYEPEILQGMGVSDIHPAASLSYVAACFEQLAKGDKLHFDNIPMQRKDGSVFLTEVAVSWVKLQGRDYLTGFFRDVTERKEAEARILAALQEKELLLREIHHRVKNNLQIVASLLYLQAEQVQEPQALRLLQESRDRIKSMALVHEKLFGARDLSRVDFAGYLESLAGHLSHVYDAGRRGVRIEVAVRDVTLGIDVAAPCGLIVHELISNAFKYAFPGGRPGTVRLGASRGPGGTVALVVEDDGVGLPPDLEVKRSPSLGLRLVRQLVEQLHGRLSVSTNGGARFQIAFSDGTERSKEGNDGA